MVLWSVNEFRYKDCLCNTSVCPQSVIDWVNYCHTVVWLWCRRDTPILVLVVARRPPLPYYSTMMTDRNQHRGGRQRLAMTKTPTRTQSMSNGFTGRNTNTGDRQLNSRLGHLHRSHESITGALLMTPTPPALLRHNNNASNALLTRSRGSE